MAAGVPTSGRQRYNARDDADALDGAALDLPEGTLALLLAEREGLAGRLDLALDRLGAATDPVRVAG
jgi:hypothetical protein